MSPSQGLFPGGLGAETGHPVHPAGGAGRGRTARAGPSPVSAVEAFEEVTDSLCISQYSKDGEERVVLFLKMASGHSFQPGLVRRVQDAIRAGLSARHVPSLVLETKGIPVRPPAGSVSCRLAAATRAPSPPASPRVRGLSPSSLLVLYIECVLVA